MNNELKWIYKEVVVAKLCLILAFYWMDRKELLKTCYYNRLQGYELKWTPPRYK